MSEKSNISVIIPTYNRREKLTRAIDSVRAQTLAPNEIIVVDDNSDLPVKEFLASRYGDSVRVITNSGNLGAAESRNIGVKNAAGDYIAFLDSDDYWAPEKLEKQMTIFKTHPEARLVYCDQWVVNEDGTCRESGKKLINKDILGHLLEWWTPPNTSTLCFTRSVYYKIGGFDPTLTSCQDHDLWMRIAMESIKVAFSSEPLCYFTRDADNRTSFDSNNRFRGMERFLSKWKEQIIVLRGEKHYRWFKKNYQNNAACPIFFPLIERAKLFKALKIYLRYLAFNPLFYKYVLKGLLKKSKWFGRFPALGNR